MITEALVAIACLNNQGCPQTMSAYYMSHPEIKKLATRTKVKAEELAGPTAVGMAPGLILIIKKRASFRITNYMELQISQDTGKIVLTFPF